MAFRPEEIEEEGRPEDGGHVDAYEDVVGGDADEVVIVDFGAGPVGSNPVLLVDVVYDDKSAYASRRKISYEEGKMC